MTDTPYVRSCPRPPLWGQPSQGLAPDAEQLLLLAERLGPRDLVALTNIVRRTAEICERDGEETALAVIDQIIGIVRNRLSDA